MHVYCVCSMQIAQQGYSKRATRAISEYGSYVIAKGYAMMRAAPWMRQRSGNACVGVRQDTERHGAVHGLISIEPM